MEVGVGCREARVGGRVNDDIDRTRDAACILRTDIQRQRDLAEHYAAEQQTIDDDESRAIMARIEAHDRYQAEQLETMLERLEEASGDGTSFPVEPKSLPEPPPPAAPPLPRFTVGSLFGRKQDE